MDLTRIILLALTVVGFALIVTGVALLSGPAALIVAGVLLAAFCLLGVNVDRGSG